MKLPHTHKQLQQALNEARAEGYRNRMQHEEENKKKNEAGFLRQQQEARLQALKAATALASALGQSIGELSRAMCSEAGQL